MTLIGPDRVAQRFKWEASVDVYKGLDDFVEHVVAIQRQMISELVKAGCKYIQIDAPGYTAYVDEVSLNRMRSRGENPERNLQRSIDADNAVIEGFPDVTFGIHVCRGNARTIDPKTGKLVPQWHREGHYDAIAARNCGADIGQRLRAFAPQEPQFRDIRSRRVQAVAGRPPKCEAAVPPEGFLCR